jgi:ribonucleoside-diphosphate reductase alpha chain
MNTANWIQDEFMRRVHENGEWTLFSPDEVTDLHNLYGSDFSEAYHRYEQLADEGKIKLFKRVSAIELWRKMLTMLFETGHPWICFSDPCNIRNPQQHTGQIHSSNLCTEIALNTNESEVAVCNLASINLANHIIDGQLDKAKLTKTIQIGMRMLDNVIDINFYPIPEARDSNSKHRPVGLGLMGFQDALYKLRIPFASKQAVDFSDETMEFISYQAILASTHLAQERGKYKTFDGSLWSQGILPIDSIAKLKESRGEYLEMSTDSTLDWDSLRKRVKTVGMRNSNTMAIAPTATISSVCGVSQSIEPNYQNLFVKTNLSGDFTVINPYLVNDLKALGLWDEVMMNDLKYFDGSIHAIERVPAELKALYLQAFEIEPSWIVELASRRQKWIDQSQSVNLYLSEPSGRKLDSLYKLAWIRGLKTTYYLRTLGATHVEKNTLSTDKLVKAQCTVQTCSMPDPSDIECEACQ